MRPRPETIPTPPGCGAATEGVPLPGSETDCSTRRGMRGTGSRVCDAAANDDVLGSHPDSGQRASPHDEIVTAGHFSPDDPSRRAVCPSAQEDSRMIEQGSAAKAERGGAGSAGGDPLRSRFSRTLPGDQAETRSQQAFRGLLTNVLDAERCFDAAPHQFVWSARRKHGDSPRWVLNAEGSRLLGSAARQRNAFHRHDRKPETRRFAASAAQDRVFVTQPNATCLVHPLDSVQNAPPYTNIVKASHFSPNDSARQTVCSGPKRRGGTRVGSITVSGTPTT